MGHRERDDRVSNSGTYYYSGTGITKFAEVRHGVQQVCDDVDPGWGSDNYFNLEKVETRVPGVSGEKIVSGVVTRKLANYPVAYRPPPPSLTPLGGLPSFEELQQKCVHVAAMTNPSRALVSAPTTIGELKDIPMLTRGLGRNLLRAVAKGWITWRFALKPLISDLVTLSKFTKSVQARFEYLDRLSRGELVSKTVSLGTNQFDLDPEDVVIHSEGAMITGSRQVTLKRVEWANIKWRLMVSPPLCVKARYDLAERLVLGITSYELLQAAWELQPWSWLIDWFYDVGSWLQANNNTVPAIASGFCWMATDSAESAYAIDSMPDWVTLDGPHLEKTVRKVRLVPNVTSRVPPLPALPALKAGQWSILGALALIKSPIARRR